MSITTRWSIALEHEVAAPDVDAGDRVRPGAIERWVETGRDAYVDQSRILTARAADGAVALRRAPVKASGAPLARAPRVLVTASATEVLAASFVVAVRLRTLGGNEDQVRDFRCEVALTDPATGRPAELEPAIRDELIALEHAARHYS